MKIGFDEYTLKSSGYEDDPFSLMETAVKFGLEGIHFSVAVDTFPSFEDDYLKRVRDYAEEHDLYLEFGMGTCNPLSTCRAVHDIHREPEVSLRELLVAASKAGASLVRTLVGALDVRDTRGTPKFQEHLDAAKVTLNSLKGLAGDLGVKIAVENHLDLTAVELRQLVEDIDSPAVGCCFDTANTLAMLEDPVEAYRTLMPYIFSTHFKDGILVPWEGGAAWIGILLGSGQAKVAEIGKLLGENLPDVNLSIEDLWNVFPVPLSGEYTLSLPHYAGEDGKERVRQWLRESEERNESGELSFIDRLKDPETRWQVTAERIPKNVEWMKRFS